MFAASRRPRRLACTTGRRGGRRAPRTLSLKRLERLEALFSDPALAAEIAAHDQTSAELSRYKLGSITAVDSDGYHRVCCPAVAGKLRCPLRTASMALSYTQPTVLEPPRGTAGVLSPADSHRPGPGEREDESKARLPGEAWRRSYARRSAVERSNSRIKDPATIDVQKGWCRIIGLVGPSMFLAMAFCCRNLALVGKLGRPEGEKEGSSGEIRNGTRAAFPSGGWCCYEA